MNHEILVKHLATWGISPTQAQLDALAQYADLLISTNKQFNLTSITDPEQIYLQHFLDSAALLPHLTSGSTLIDIGTGAGFPGLVLKILSPSLKVTLLDATEKKCRFLTMLITTLGLKAVDVVCVRAEDYARQAGRERFDYVTSRAVGKLSLLIELGAPLLKQGGQLVAYKGPRYTEELTDALNAAKALKLSASSVIPVTLPADLQRVIITYIKEAPTPSKYPRAFAEMKRRPL